MTTACFCCFFLYTHRHHRDLHSFPTRRSSDLRALELVEHSRVGWRSPEIGRGSGSRKRLARRQADRSEEHTSELQSLTNLVCRLLLEKKKKKTTHHPQRPTENAHILPARDSQP